jgi:hypothetical protein
MASSPRRGQPASGSHSLEGFKLSADEQVWISGRKPGFGKLNAAAGPYQIPIPASFAIDGDQAFVDGRQVNHSGNVVPIFQ